MSRFSMQTEIAVVIADGDQHLFDVWVDYDYSPSVPAYTPRGEYAPIDPPEPATAEVVHARWRECSAGEGEKFQDCPGWLISLMAEDDSLQESLISDAELSERGDPDYLYEMRRDDGQPGESQEWRDYDPDC